MSRGSLPLVTSAEMAELDRQAQQRYHIAGLVLMENAGARTWQLLRDRFLQQDDRNAVHPARRVVFVAGKGNNGGDALVMARHCAVEQAHHAEVVITSDNLREPGASHLRACGALGVAAFDWSQQKQRAQQAIAQADWIVDGIAGTGISGALSGELAELADCINASSGRVAAIDCPSGIGDDYEGESAAVRAQVTITIGLPKRCLYYRRARAAAGEIVVLPIGFPPPLLEAVSSDWRLLHDRALDELLPPLSRTAYKNQRGVVAVFAGTHGTSGAAVLCSRAAACSSAGMVRLYADESVYPIVAPQLVSVMTQPCATEGEVNLAGATALAIGPGWGRAEARDRRLAALIDTGLPGVIDADGLVALKRLHASDRLPSLAGRWVLTPHAGELATFCGIARDELGENPVPLLRQWSARLQAVIVLKGHVNYVVRPEGDVAIVDGMNPALGTGGSGDVLSGIVAALLGRGLEAGQAAEAAVLLHQLAGRRLYAERGLFLAEELPAVLSVLIAEFPRGDE